ncbi:MAG TPA: hypothetical protein VFX49_05480 [Chloroflexota bacterium]|nr:hypothetical protein [Chloroflexota bacterium]
MYSSLIGKVQKAHTYAQQPERIRVDDLTLAFRGDNGDHRVTYRHGAWDCTCEFFAGWGICCHTMAVEQLLGVMIPTKQHLDLPVPA